MSEEIVEVDRPGSKTCIHKTGPRKAIMQAYTC